MKKNLISRYLLSCGLMLIIFQVHAQMTKESGQATFVKNIVMRDIRLLNDPNFIPNGHHKSNVQKVREPQKKRNLIPRPENTFKARTVSTLKTGPGSGSRINEDPCQSYMSMQHGNFIPPDVAGAVGHDHLLLTENDSFRIMDKYGNNVYQQLQQDAAGFWAGTFSNNLFDPKIIYDPFQNRWIHVILADSDLASSSILFAVSAGPDPNAQWSLWSIDTDAENDQWFDYPSVGFNSKWLVINGVMFPTTGSSAPQVSRTYVFDITKLYFQNLAIYTVFSNSEYRHITPALTYDPNLPDLWCVTNNDIDDNDLRFFRISGTPDAPDFSEEGFISISPDWGRGGADIAPQAGTSIRINAGDHRVLSVMWRNGILYLSQTVFLPAGGSPTTCTIQYVSCDPVTETVHEALRFIADANSMYAYSNLVVNANSDIIISCARFTTDIFPSACVLVRRNGNPVWIENIFKAGEDWYVNYDSNTTPRNRWGDYTSAAVDPSDDQSVWVVSQYSRPQANPTAGRWGTWCAKICSGICEPTVTMNVDQPPATFKKYEASNIVYANSQIFSGAGIKLDGGNKVVLQPGFKALYGSHFRTFIEGCNGPQ